MCLEKYTSVGNCDLGDFRAASSLGVSRPTLYQMLARYGLKKTKAAIVKRRSSICRLVTSPGAIEGSPSYQKTLLLTSFDGELSLPDESTAVIGK